MSDRGRSNLDSLVKLEQYDLLLNLMNMPMVAQEEGGMLNALTGTSHWVGIRPLAFDHRCGLGP